MTTFKPLPPPANSGGEPGMWAYIRRIYDAMRGVQSGKLNCVDSVTLLSGTVTTAYMDPRIGPASHIGFTPTTANAKSEGTPAVTARVQGQATLTHSSAASGDRTYTTIIIG